MSTPPARVVVTGAGIVTALGLGWSANALGFKEGRIAFRPVTLFDVSRQRVRSAAQVDLPPEVPKSRLSRRQVQRLDRAAKLLLWAAHEAWNQSGWSAGSRLPVVLGTTSGGMTLGEEYYRTSLGTPRQHLRQASRVLHYQSQRQGHELANAFGF